MTIEDIKKTFETWERVLGTLREVLSEKESDIVRDAAIKRFEYNFELAWKAIKKLANQEGVDCNSPKSAFKEALKFNWIDDDEIWLDMLSDRNLSTHTYQESTAEAIYHRISGYYEELARLYHKLKEL